MEKNKKQNKEIEIALAILHKALPKAVDTLITLLESKDAKIRLRAAVAIREFILGKPVKTIRIKNDST